MAKKNMLGTASAWKDATHIFGIGAAFRVSFLAAWMC